MIQHKHIYTMEKLQISVDDVKNRSVKVLSNMGNTNSHTEITVESNDPQPFLPRIITEWLKQNDTTFQAEGQGTSPLKQQQVWESAFPNLEDKDINVYENTFLFSKDATNARVGNPNTTVVTMQKATVTLTDGTKLNNVVYVAIGDDVEKPKKVMIFN